MSQWTEQILSRFTADLDRLWVACDPDDVLLDEKLLAELRSRGFELMLYEEPERRKACKGGLGQGRTGTRVVLLHSPGNDLARAAANG